jgi:hypothetical protein
LYSRGIGTYFWSWTILRDGKPFGAKFGKNTKKVQIYRRNTLSKNAFRRNTRLPRCAVVVFYKLAALGCRLNVGENDTVKPCRSDNVNNSSAASYLGRVGVEPALRKASVTVLAAT